MVCAAVGVGEDDLAFVTSPVVGAVGVPGTAHLAEPGPGFALDHQDVFKPFEMGVTRDDLRAHFPRGG